MNSVAIDVRGLKKSYGDVHAVRDVSFQAHRSEIFGLLGPNGAGKTTTMEILEGLTSADAGSVHLLGGDLASDLPAIRQRIGAQLQATALYRYLTVREHLELFASFYEVAADVNDVISLVQLEDKADARTTTLSGGQRQRLAIALALVNDPELIFLDEPTTGLDPQVRAHVWDIIKGFRARGKTVVLTTHYMAEAERICDRLCIMDRGRIIAEGTPAELVARDFPHPVIRMTAPSFGVQPLRDLAVVVALDEEPHDIALHVRDVADALSAIGSVARAHGSTVDDLRVVVPTLEDVFLKLTGRQARE